VAGRQSSRRIPASEERRKERRIDPPRACLGSMRLPGSPTDHPPLFFSRFASSIS
jgi:hypothetical protein